MKRIRFYDKLRYGSDSTGLIKFIPQFTFRLYSAFCIRTGIPVPFKEYQTYTPAYSLQTIEKLFRFFFVQFGKSHHRGLAVARVHVFTRFVHYLYYLIKRYFMLALQRFCESRRR